MDNPFGASDNLSQLPIHDLQPVTPGLGFMPCPLTFCAFFDGRTFLNIPEAVQGFAKGLPFYRDDLGHFGLGLDFGELEGHGWR